MFATCRSHLHTEYQGIGMSTYRVGRACFCGKGPSIRVPTSWAKAWTAFSRSWHTRSFQVWVSAGADLVVDRTTSEHRKSTGTLLRSSITVTRPVQAPADVLCKSSVRHRTQPMIEAWTGWWSPDLELRPRLLAAYTNDVTSVLSNLNTVYTHEVIDYCNDCGNRTTDCQSIKKCPVLREYMWQK
jgi:hypothetical protein